MSFPLLLCRVVSEVRDWVEVCRLTEITYKLVEIGQSTTFAPSLALVMMLTSKVQPCCRVLVRILFLFVTLSLSGYLGARVGPISSTSVEHWELTSAIHLL